MDLSAVAVQGLEQAQAMFTRAAVAVSSVGVGSADGSGVDTVSLSDAAVAMIAAKTQFAANISVMKKADDMQKSVINLLG